jgi:hypothetical protein
MNGHEDLDLSASGMAAKSRPSKGGTSSNPALEGVRGGHERCAFESYEVEAESSRVGEQLFQELSAGCGKDGKDRRSFAFARAFGPGMDSAQPWCLSEPIRTDANGCTKSTSWGHWFEPSTAHTKPWKSGIFVCCLDDACSSVLTAGSQVRPNRAWFHAIPTRWC